MEFNAHNLERITYDIKDKVYKMDECVHRTWMPLLSAKVKITLEQKK